jgi:hypothetical protein
MVGELSDNSLMDLCFRVSKDLRKEAEEVVEETGPQ